MSAIRLGPEHGLMTGNSFEQANGNSHLSEQKVKWRAKQYVFRPRYESDQRQQSDSAHSRKRDFCRGQRSAFSVYPFKYLHASPL